MADNIHLIGKQVGNYRITAKIADGSFGSVYQAHHHILTNRVVALKVLHMHLPAKERERFIQEAHILECLQHRHILAIIDIGFEDGMPYLVAEYASGGSLRQFLNQSSSERLSWEKILTILTQVGEALQYAHQQHIIHCDLKPENILFNAQGEALLADFGIATVLSTVSVKHLTHIEGTPSYMAPEQFRGEVAQESDQYALGCIAYELVTRQRLFSAPNLIAMGYKHATEPPIPPSHINSQIPKYVEQAILKALAKQRDDRHAHIAAFLTALQEPAPFTKEEWLEKGNKDYQLCHFEEALSAYNQALQLDPHYASAYNGKGSALYHLNHIEEALEAYTHAIHLDPNLAHTYYNIGNALYTLKRYGEALKVYEHAIRLVPNYAHAYTGKGNILRDLERHKEALKAYEQAIQLDPSSAPAYYGKGNVLFNLKQYKEALETYEHTIHLNPSYASAYYDKGITLLSLKRYEEALKAYEQAIRLDPNNALTYYGKGATLRYLKRYEEALEAYNRYIQLDPHNAQAYYGKGATLRLLKRYEEALEAYEQVIQIDPNNASAYYDKGLVLDHLKRPAEAQRAYETAKHFGR